MASVTNVTIKKPKCPVEILTTLQKIYAMDYKIIHSIALFGIGSTKEDDKNYHKLQTEQIVLLTKYVILYVTQQITDCVPWCWDKSDNSISVDIEYDPETIPDECKKKMNNVFKKIESFKVYYYNKDFHHTKLTHMGKEIFEKKSHMYYIEYTPKLKNN